MKVLILVNPQIDFCEGGALEIPGAAALLQKLHIDLSKYQLVLGLRESHPADHISFAQSHPWRRPGQSIDWQGYSILLQISHCVAGQFGALLHTPFQESDFTKLYDLGTDREKETDQEVPGLCEQWINEYWQKVLPESIRLAGCAHNDIFSILNKCLSEKNIPVIQSPDDCLQFQEPKPFQ